MWQKEHKFLSHNIDSLYSNLLKSKSLYMCLIEHILHQKPLRKISLIDFVSRSRHGSPSAIVTYFHTHIFYWVAVLEGRKKVKYLCRSLFMTTGWRIWVGECGLGMYGTGSSSHSRHRGWQHSGSDSGDCFPSCLVWNTAQPALPSRLRYLPALGKSG